MGEAMIAGADIGAWIVLLLTLIALGVALVLRGRR